MTPLRSNLGGGAAAVAVLLLGCEPAPDAGRTDTSAGTVATSAPPAVTTSAAAAPSRPTAGRVAPLASGSTASPSSLACPTDMALVNGNYCRRTKQRCLERPKVLGTNTYKQCQRYEAASCLDKERRPMRFCMDRYEWPNQKGQLPRTLVSWPEARKFCASVGKRLCTEHEWQFACEGETMKAHVYGDRRDDSKCNFDRPYIARTYNYEPWDECMAKPACKKEYERLDQRKPAGSMPGCVSEHGVYDLNGNANEWVFRTDQRSPRRSGLKGGWWGPVRNRCRPMTTFHLEGDYGYEVGFRCCRDAEESSP
ncbi:MAG: SUMF1/EgtB/PvdO family nonheme iron enzyme [Myxococcota bacterium]